MRTRKNQSNNTQIPA